jgi:transposase
MGMVLFGVDPHKDTHTVVAVDQAGRQLDQRTVPARTLGHGELVGWARMHWPERLWAVEDCWHVTGRLERDLLAAGERVVRVPPRLMAGARQAVRALGKSDPIDALAVARAALREPDLHTAGHDQASWEVKLLVDHREHLVAERTRQINRLRWHLHQLDPDLEHTTRRLPGPGLRRITAWLAQTAADAGSLVQVTICQAQLAAISLLTDQIGELDRQLRQRVTRLAPTLLSLPGCGPLTAAKLIAETAGVARFRSEACFAMHADVAPVPVSSGRHRVCRGGNRQLNAALHRIAITQLRLPGPGQAYYQRRRAQGDGTGEAVRSLKRRIARAVYQRLRGLPARAAGGWATAARVAAARPVARRFVRGPGSAAPGLARRAAHVIGGRPGW